MLQRKRRYGYARVSSREQNLDRQIKALTDYGVTERDIIIDKQSGKDFSRPGYQQLKAQLLRSGDILVITEFDRLGRNYDELKQEYADLLTMGISVVFLETPMLNTLEKTDIEKTLIGSIMFELLACPIVQRQPYFCSCNHTN